ncbi:MAG TPA: FlgD immunoglobulin-like domain containing protein [Bacteroidia bacterium]|jgi:hypothetical protein|nr:FlgD immunoglobulin-like domain containing protein [Bacteroidia bacterium]
MKKILLSLMMLMLFVGYKLTAQTVYKDVAPIFIKKCTSCHHENMHAPSFVTYSKVSPYATRMRDEVEEGSMPPWLPDTTYTRFSHERILTASEKAAIISWIDGGALPGDTTLAPPVPHYSKYQISAPADLEVQIPAFTSNGSTKDVYNCFYVKTGLTEDRYIKAFEIVAGNDEIVHHVLVGVDTMGDGTNDLSGNCYSMPGDFLFGGFAPGTEATFFPSRAPLKAGVFLKAGSQISFQIHYPQGSAGKKDSTKIRLYFYPKGETGIRRVYAKTLLQNWILPIDANTVKTFTATSYVGMGTTLFSGEYDASIMACFPHAHALCTVMKNYAIPGAFSTGDTIPPIRINDWDFDWQGFSTFRKLVKVPKNFQLKSEHTYDNTENNPNQPSHPPVNVKAGPATSDEMLFDSFMWLKYEKGDEHINIDSIISLDPLITGVAEYNYMKNRIESKAYPNPFENSVTISYALESTSPVYIEVFTLQGVSVKVLRNELEMLGSHEVVWDGKNANGTSVANGAYIYVIKAGSKQTYGKLTVLPSKK